jgi:ribonuclease HI
MDDMDRPPTVRPGELAAMAHAPGTDLGDPARGDATHGGGDVEDPLDADATEVLRRELNLLKPSVRAEPDAVLALLHADFTEIGVSGQVWDRSGVAEALAAEPSRTGQAPDNPRALMARITDRLAPDVIQVTYTTREPERTCRRASVWVRDRDGSWLMRFHQGTAVPEPPD